MMAMMNPFGVGGGLVQQFAKRRRMQPTQQPYTPDVPMDMVGNPAFTGTPSVQQPPTTIGGAPDIPGIGSNGPMRPFDPNAQPWGDTPWMPSPEDMPPAGAAPPDAMPPPMSPEAPISPVMSAINQYRKPQNRGGGFGRGIGNFMRRSMNPMNFRPAPRAMGGRSLADLYRRGGR